MPASWEIQRFTSQKVILATLQPPDGTITPQKADSDHSLILPAGSNTYKVIGLPYGPARNDAAKWTLEHGYSGIFFLDSDIRPLDPEIVIKLIGTGYDLIGGLYYQRFHPFNPAFFGEGINSKGEILKTTISGWKPGDIIEATFVPSGATYYSLKCLEHMFTRFPRPFEWGLDSAPVPSEDGPLIQCSEDFMFSYRAKHILGIQPYIHTGLACLHEVRAVVGPRWSVKGPDYNSETAGICGTI